MEDKTKPTAEDKLKKVRSPQFPFIPLEKAVLRAREFEAHYTRHSARAANAVKVWGYAEKSSGGIQTIAALSAYGLLEDEGSLDSRKIKLTPLAMTILKDSRPGAAKEALKIAALKPRILAELWSWWGLERPPAQECISTLHLEKQFSEEAAARLVHIYDATIKFAGLATLDKIDDNGAGAEEVSEEPEGDKPPLRDKPPLPPKGKVPLMENERVVFAHEIRPNQSFRIVVAGEVDAAMVEALKAFAEFQEKLVSRRTAPPKEDPNAPSQG